MTKGKIPSAVIAVVGDVLGKHYYHHDSLDTLFTEHGAPGDPPPGSCVKKCKDWLKRANDDPAVDAFMVLGGVLKEFMEADTKYHDYEQRWLQERERTKRILAEHGLSYHTSGRILGAGVGAPSQTLEDKLRKRDFPAVEKEFQRALESVESDPPIAVTAACAIIEALCKVYIQEENLAMPPKQTIKPLWALVQKHLGLDAGLVVDQDLQRVLSGLSSIVDGVGAFRTHAGSAHGHSPTAYPVEGRHARLTINAAHTVVTFVLESWEKKKGK